jgi:hypothetical protein
MTPTARQTDGSSSRGVSSLWVPAAAMLLPMAALAQGNACDQLKATLAARIEASGVRGYSLEAVPAATPVPPGAKAIGNCEGGERKILYRRWGGASAPARAEVAMAPAPAPVAAAEPPPKRPPPVVRPDVPVPVASVPALKPSPVPTAKAEAAMPPPARASEVLLAPMAESVLPQAAQALPAEAVEEKPPLSQRVSGFVAAYWRWLLALVLVPLVALGWAWRAHHLAYDRNGLPRGPRL